MTSTRVGLFGGSFNPVHQAHVQLAEAVQNEWPCSPLIIMPTQTPPHKQPFTVAAEHRLAMAKLAFEKLPHIEISQDELLHQGPNYTYETLLRLQQKYPGAEFCLVIGADSFLDLPQWYQWEKLKKLCTFVVGIRVGTRAGLSTGPQTDAIDKMSNDLAAEGIKVFLLKAQLPAISSSQIRTMLETTPAAKLDGLVPDAVASYLKKNNLYAKPTDHV